MKRPKGPELKVPEIKLPAFAEDVVWDLRERRLLPLVALILVAIVATPFLLGSDSEKPAATGIARAPSGSEGATAEASRLTVVQAKPGLRDYRKRLARRSPTDPFVQRFSSPVVDKSKLNPESSSPGGSVPVGGEESGGAEPTPAPSAPPVSSSPGKGGKPPNLTLFAFAIKVSITKAGGKQAGSKSKKEKTVRDRVLPNTPLPGKKAAVVTYMGPGANGKKALLLLSTKVNSVFGEIRCVTPNEDICQLVEVEPGFPVTFVYGGNEVRYTINVIKIEPVVTGKL